MATQSNTDTLDNSYSTLTQQLDYIEALAEALISSNGTEANKTELAGLIYDVNQRAKDAARQLLQTTEQRSSAQAAA